MKKTILLLAVLFMFPLVTLADGPTATTPSITADSANQNISNENNYAGFNIEKQPTQENGKQSISNKKSWFNINIIINGKYMPKEAN